MPDHTQPQLATTARRARAAAMILAETRLPALPAQTVADIVDAVSAAVLRSAGCTDPAARAILGALWEQSP